MRNDRDWHLDEAGHLPSRRELRLACEVMALLLREEFGSRGLDILAQVYAPFALGADELHALRKVDSWLAAEVPELANGNGEH